jgi:hypothetical protein
VRIEVRDESSIKVRRAAKRKKQKNFPTKKKPEKSVDDPGRLIEAAEGRFQIRNSDFFRSL